MFRKLKKTIAAIMTGLTIRPVTQSPVPPSSSITDEAQKLEKSQGEYRTGQHDYSYLHARYTGLRTSISDPSRMIIASGARMRPVAPERFRNHTVTVTDPLVEEFISKRSS